VTSCVGSVGSRIVLSVSAVGGRLGVGVGVDDNAAQPLNRSIAIDENDILIMISMNKYKGKAPEM
jgi:hypothetical protein